MKFRSLCVGITYVVFSSLLNPYPLRAISLDREAFSITNYDLDLQVDPEQQRLAARGTITLRNDSSSPQKIAVLQISSSLAWRSIKAGGEGVQFVTQPYTSDIDHTGALSEAIVTLPAAVAPKGTVELDVGYEGIVAPDATRLTRIGTPEAAANSSDWDQISPQFIGLRGAGHVAWYPIASEVANLSEDDSLFDVLGRWKTREAGSKMHLLLGLNGSGADLDADKPQFYFNGVPCMVTAMGFGQRADAECPAQPLREDAPTLIIADYKVLERSAIEVHYLPGHDVAAANFADAADKVVPLISEWFGPLREKAKTGDLPVAGAAPFESGALLLTSLSDTDANQASLAAAHQLTHGDFLSFRPWIEEGLAHFAQTLYLERQKGRKAALDYMATHRAAFEESEPSTTAPRSDDEVNRSLINTASEDLYRTKAMYVWWMLRDMVGEAALKKAIAAYRPEEDKEPSYMQRLIQAQTQRDLEWFFDDWVYRDHGLPDFKIDSAFSRKTMTDAYMLTVTVENMGTAGAEVPLFVKFSGGEKLQRLEVRAKAKAVIRMEIPGAPSEVVVNDGSVPEIQLKNNMFPITNPGQ